MLIEEPFVRCDCETYNYTTLKKESLIYTMVNIRWHKALERRVILLLRRLGTWASTSAKSEVLPSEYADRTASCMRE